MIEFAMVDMKISQFAIISAPKSISQQYKITIGFSADIKSNTIACSVRLDFISENETYLVLELICFFNISAKSWESLRKDTKIVIPKGLLCHFAMHSVGSARGVLFCKTEDSHKIILPPINVEEIVENEIEIDG